MRLWNRGQESRSWREAWRLRALVVAASALFVVVANTATITVDRGDGTVDPTDGMCSLPEAIAAANTDSPSGAAAGECPAGSGADTIRLLNDVVLTVPVEASVIPGGPAGELGPSGLPVITTDLVIDGSGFTVQRDPAAPPFRVMTFFGDPGDVSRPTLTLDDVEIRNGVAGEGDGCSSNCQRGGGILQFGGTLILSGSSVSGNTSSFRGGAVASGSYLYFYPEGARPQLILSNTEVIGNSSGIYNGSSELILVDSVVANNDVFGVYHCGRRFFGCKARNVTITTSEISGNQGAGLFAYGNVADVTNTTFSGNFGAIGFYQANVSVSSSTFIGNSGLYAAIYGFGYGYGDITLTDSVLGHGDSPEGPNCSAVVIDGGNNLSDDASCGTIPAALTGVDPVLADNGGPTRTHALLPDSSAIDAAGMCGMATDQRGFPRDDGACDSGAFEYRGCGFADGDPACAVCNSPEILDATTRVTDDPATSDSPALLWNGSGFGVVWQDDRTGVPEVFFAALDPFGGRLGSDVQVSEVSGASFAPLAVWNGAEYGIVWHDDRDGNHEIYFARLDAAGDKLGDDVRITNDPASSANPWLVWNGSGYGLAWRDERDGNQEIYFALLDAAGSKSGTDIRITADPAVSSGQLVAWTGSGYGILWQDERDGNRELYFTRLAPDGTKLNGDVRVTDDPALSTNNWLAWTGSEYGIAWRDQRTGSSELFFASLDPLGAPLTPATQLTDSSSAKGGTRLIWSGAEFLLVWQDQRDGNREIYLARIDASGTKLGDDLRFTNRQGDSRSASVDWTGTGFGLAWVDDRFGNHEIYFGRLGCNCLDADLDGFTSCEECFDTHAAVFPGAPQVCDGFNNDCDAPDWPVVDPDELDTDGDGVRPCGGDCDDSQATVRPGAEEICDGLNNDCDDPSWPTPHDEDLDDDADGHRVCDGDCDDADPAVFPGTLEEYDGIDNDCDGDTDEGVPRLATKLLASDGTSQDRFGYAVSVDGTTALIGAYADSVVASVSGSAYVFERDAGDPDTWNEIIKLAPADGVEQDRFGFSVSVRGDLALIGAPGFTSGGVTRVPGAAYVFERDAGGPEAWGQVARLTASDGEPGDLFGFSVSLDGDTALVGAYRNGPSGAAYVFRREAGGSWSEVAKLTAADAATSDRFGEVVSLSGDTALIGAPLDDDAGSSSGSAYVYERDAGGIENWGEVAKLASSDLEAGDRFGSAVAISGDRLVVSAIGGAKPVYLFERGASEGDWNEFIQLSPLDPMFDQLFGHAISIDGDRVLVGAYRDDHAGNRSGAAYLFERIAGGPDNWGQVAKLVAPDAEAGDHFGFAVAIRSDFALAGAPMDLFVAGSAYLFEYVRPRCGDGNHQPPEECDDGNDVDDDGCATDCRTSCADQDGDGFGAPGFESCPAGGAADCDDGDPSIHPGMPEACNGLDDNCNGLADEDENGQDIDLDGHPNACDNCASVVNVSQSDLDDDSEGDHCDLDDGTIYLTPGEPDVVEWQQETGFLAWNVYRGDLSVLRTTGVYAQAPGSNPLASRQCGVGQPSLDDPTVPDVNAVAFYLVTGVDDGVESDLGVSGNGSPRPNANPCP